MDIRSRLKIMAFLQYFIWGSWVVTLGAYLIRTLGFNGSQVGNIYSAKGLAAVLMPALLGWVADRFMPVHRLYGLCHLLSAGTLFLAADTQGAEALFLVMLVNMMAYMPTMALSNALCYQCLTQAGLDRVRWFPPIRVFGTLGFIAGMWCISLLQLELSAMQLRVAGGASLLLAVYAMTLPAQARTGAAVQAPADGEARRPGWLWLWRQPGMAVFFCFAVLLGAVLQITNTFGSPFLHDFASQAAFQDSLVVRYPAMLLSVSQMSELLFILAIPWVLRRFGIKTVVLVSMLAWTLRFGFFALGDPSPWGMVFLLLSMLVYGCAFDFFNISGSLFVEQSCPPEMRAGAQGLFMTLVNGLGAFAGAQISGWVVDRLSHDGVRDWPAIWAVFAAYTLVLAMVFALVFRQPPPPNPAAAVGAHPAP